MGLKRYPSPTALRSPLSPRERAVTLFSIPLPRGEGCYLNFYPSPRGGGCYLNFYPSPWGRGCPGMSGRVRGLFAEDAFIALKVCVIRDFD